MNRQPAIGIQLYTVRDLTDDGKFQNTLRALAGLGFEGVEFAWKYGGMEPSQLAAFLDSLGLRCCGLHAALDELLDPMHRVYDYVKATASPFITTSLASRVSEWEALTPQIARASEVAAANGVTFTYHNHAQEFDSNAEGLPFDRLVAATDVKLELDLGWIEKAGGDPDAVWASQAHRIPQIHLRDYDRATQQMCDVGQGFINVQAILETCRQRGVEWLIYEQDAYPVSPMASCEACMAAINAVRSCQPSSCRAGSEVIDTD